MNPDTITENGALAYSTTSDRGLDLFFQINAMRDRPSRDLEELFVKAFGENPLDALRILFWSRDIRGGQGERKAFRTLLNWMAVNHPTVMEKNLHLVSEYGRWDDILSVIGTDLEKAALTLIEQALKNGDGLCAKWMPRDKSAKRKTAAKIRKFMGLSYANYRKMLSGLTKTVESQMCSGEWDEINYEHVPSMAMKNYRNAFKRHNEEGWGEYLSQVESGEKKINAGAMYPHDIVRNILNSCGGYWHQGKPSISADDARSLEAQWKALPNYMEGNSYRVLPVADVSGSMSGIPMEVCISLSLYVSERNVGPFKDAFITFSNNPQLQYVKAGTLVERVMQLRSADWGGSTDLEKTFKVILKRAIEHSVPEDDMPEMIVIFSDMQFNCVIGGKNSTLFDSIKAEYEKAGYSMPKVAFWNLRAASGNFPVQMNENGVALVSGFSPSTMKQLLTTGDFSPELIMRQTIDSERYEAVTV